VIREAALSMSRRSPSVSSTAAAATFSCKRCSFVVPESARSRLLGKEKRVRSGRASFLAERCCRPDRPAPGSPSGLPRSGGPYYGSRALSKAVFPADLPVR
jgi:hypothetical protein